MTQSLLPGRAVSATSTVNQQKPELSLVTQRQTWIRRLGKWNGEKQGRKKW